MLTPQYAEAGLPTGNGQLWFAAVTECGVTFSSFSGPVKTPYNKPQGTERVSPRPAGGNLLRLSSDRIVMNLSGRTTGLL